jgi:hypothetical protein
MVLVSPHHGEDESILGWDIDPVCKQLLSMGPGREGLWVLGGVQESMNNSHHNQIGAQ